MNSARLAELHARTARGLAMLVAVALAHGCLETGRAPATAALRVVGTDAASFTEGAFTITLTRADVAIGPLYLCATRASSADLCETAVLETRDAYTLDALDAEPLVVGELEGVTGAFATAQYDHGLPFLLGATRPEPLAGAADGHSLVLEATVTDGNDSFDLALALDVTAKVSGQSAIVGRAVTGVVPSEGGTLEVAVDARDYLRGLDWVGIAAMPRPASGPLVLPPGTPSHDAVLRALTTNHPVGLRFEVP